MHPVRGSYSVVIKVFQSNDAKCMSYWFFFPVPMFCDGKIPPMGDTHVSLIRFTNFMTGSQGLSENVSLNVF